MDPEENTKVQENATSEKKKRSGSARRKRSVYGKSLIRKKAGKATPAHCRIRSVAKINPSIDHPVRVPEELEHIEEDMQDSIGHQKRALKSINRDIAKNVAPSKLANRFKTVTRHNEGVDTKMPTWCELLKRTYAIDEVYAIHRMSMLPPMTLNNLSALFP